MTPINPWPREADCPHPLFKDFKSALINASFNHAGPVDEWGQAKSHIQTAAEVAIEADWPFWAMNRMFSEINPLVDWDQFMQTYINLLKKGVYKNEESV